MDVGPRHVEGVGEGAAEIRRVFGREVGPVIKGNETIDHARAARRATEPAEDVHELRVTGSGHVSGLVIEANNEGSQPLQTGALRRSSRQETIDGRPNPRGVGEQDNPRGVTVEIGEHLNLPLLPPRRIGVGPHHNDVRMYPSNLLKRPVIPERALIIGR